MTFPEFPGVFATYSNTAGPSLKRGSVSLTSSGANTAWTEIESSASAAYYITAVHVGSNAAASFQEGPYVVQVGLGASSSETAVVECLVNGVGWGSTSTTTSIHGVCPVAPAVLVAAGTRLSFRASKQSGVDSATPVLYVAVACCPAANIDL